VIHKKLILNTDGACRGNPGPASIGVVLRDEKGKVVGTISEAIGVTTNNHSEYEAIRLGLIRAKEMGAEKVHVRADSQLAVRQLTGVYRVKNPNIRKLFDGVKAIEAQFAKGVDYEHVRREYNQDADALANAALDY
jgi:ribonuclease HI